MRFDGIDRERSFGSLSHPFRKGSETKRSSVRLLFHPVMLLLSSHEREETPCSVPSRPGRSFAPSPVRKDSMFPLGANGFRRRSTRGERSDVHVVYGFHSKEGTLRHHHSTDPTCNKRCGRSPSHVHGGRAENTGGEREQGRRQDLGVTSLRRRERSRSTPTEKRRRRMPRAWGKRMGPTILF